MPPSLDGATALPDPGPIERAPAAAKVSVLVPSYNSGRYLRPRLASILSQTVPPAEVIVLDDASSDDSVATTEDVARSSKVPFVILCNDSNSGSPFAQWQRGLRAASHGIVWLAEADDFCAPIFLERLLPAFADPAVVLAYCQSALVDERGNTLAPDYLDWTADISPERWRSSYVVDGLTEVERALCLKNTIPNASAVLVRRDVGRASIGASDGLQWTGDWLFYAQAARRGKVAFVADTLNYHRRHEGTVTAQVIKDDRWIREYLETKCRILESVPLSPDRIAESLARAVAEEQRIDAWQGLERPSFVDRPAFAPWRERLFRCIEQALGGPSGPRRFLLIAPDLTGDDGEALISLANDLARAHRVFLVGACPALSCASRDPRLDPGVALLEGTLGPAAWYGPAADGTGRGERAGLGASPGDERPRRLAAIRQLLKLLHVDVVISRGWWADRFAAALRGTDPTPVLWLTAAQAAPGGVLVLPGAGPRGGGPPRSRGSTGGGSDRGEPGGILANPVVWAPLAEELAPFLKYCTGIVLNAGSGQREIRLGHRDLNLDLVPANHPHLLGDLHAIPLRDACVDTVVSIAVLEHVRHPWVVAREFHRVLRPGGHGVICVPFLQPQHAHPSDFTRFTEAGLAELMRWAGFEVLETAPVHHFGQTLAWLLWEYLRHHRPPESTEPFWVGVLEQLSRGELLPGDSPNTHNAHYAVIRKPGAEAAAPGYYLEALASRDSEQWFVPLLACPRTGQPLRRVGGSLVTADGACTYGLTEGIPDLRPGREAPPAGLASADGRGPFAAGDGDRAQRAEADDGRRASSPPEGGEPPAGADQWRPAAASEADSRVSFTAAWVARLREAAPARVALLVTSEYEGIFRNGGVGTYYRRLSEQLTAEGWYVLLLLTLTDEVFRGESRFPGARHLFSTREVEQVLDLQPLHRRMLAARARNPFDHQSLCALFFAQAVVDALPDTPVYVEFPEIMGTGHHTIHARQTGLLGHRCVIGVTLHGGHEWVSDAHERYAEDDPSQFRQVAWHESLSFEHADLSFFPSHFLRARIESYGWTASHAIHLPYLIPLVDGRASSDNGLPGVDGGKRPVVFFGRLEERKGLCTFLAAVRALSPPLRQRLQVVFLGKVVGLHRAPLAHLNSRGYIEQEAPGDLSYRIVPDLYSEDALRYVAALENPIVCLASPQENFPNSGLEMGQLPVTLVVSDTGGFRETLELVRRGSGVYWFAPNDARSLAAAIEEAISAGHPAAPVPRREDLEQVNRALLARRMAHIEGAFRKAAALPAERPPVTVGIVWDGRLEPLVECLSSIEAQTYPALDVIVLASAGSDGDAGADPEPARSRFPRYRFARTGRRLTRGAAWNHLLELAEGRYFLGLDAHTVLVPFGVAQLVNAACCSQAAAVCYSSLSAVTTDGTTPWSLGPLPRLLETLPPGEARIFGSVDFLRHVKQLEEPDALTQGWEVVAAALATGERIGYCPYPLCESQLPPEPSPPDEASRLKRQFQLRQYVAGIPPDRWSKRQLSMLLMVTQQPQAQFRHRPPSSAPGPGELPEGSAALRTVSAELEQARAELGLARGRISAMESSKFWALRRAWFRLKRALQLPASE